MTTCIKLEENVIALMDKVVDLKKRSRFKTPPIATRLCLDISYIGSKINNLDDQVGKIERKVRELIENTKTIMNPHDFVKSGSGKDIAILHIYCTDDNKYLARIPWVQVDGIIYDNGGKCTTVEGSIDYIEDFITTVTALVALGTTKYDDLDGLKYILDKDGLKIDNENDNSEER